MQLLKEKYTWIAIGLIALILLIDQWIKIYIKTHFMLGEEYAVAGDWFKLHFTENPGMAFGMEFGGVSGKIALSILRILAAFFGVYYIRKLLIEKTPTPYLISVCLIFAGAVGNILDSLLYGVLFDKGLTYDPMYGDYIGYTGLAQFSDKGYAPALHGCVVDMLYFPLIEGHFPDWMPIWGGEDFQFFRPIFNFADASISVGVGIILIFWKKLFPKTEASESPQTEESPKEETTSPDNSGVS